eukprot:11821705-Heterocapsa_arctica.AAC.1
MAVPRPPQGLPNAARRLKITTYNCQQSGGGARYQGLIVTLATTILALQSTGIAMDTPDCAHDFHVRS